MFRLLFEVFVTIVWDKSIKRYGQETGQWVAAAILIGLVVLFGVVVFSKIIDWERWGPILEKTFPLPEAER